MEDDIVKKNQNKKLQSKEYEQNLKDKKNERE
jgi:hypothetical protein